MRDVIARGALVLAIAAWIAAEILEGLDYAHRKGEGVIHRDLSPRNVMLSRDGEVKLVDFGLALAGDRARHAHAGASLPAGSRRWPRPASAARSSPRVGPSTYSIAMKYVSSTTPSS